jgi:hypothetical protein
MDGLLLWHPEIVHSGRKHKFSSYYTPKVSEVLRITPIYHFGFSGVEWMLRNCSALTECIQARNTSFASFFVPKFSEIIRNIRKHHFASNGLEWMLDNFGTPK